MMLIPVAAIAQSGTNSPYSQYGLGILNDQATGFNRGMSGVGIAMHDHNQVNYLNPASYSQMDSLTFIFDVGASLQLTNFSENGKRLNAKNADFEYAVMGFRTAKNLGMSIGILPFSNIGYNYSSTDKISNDNLTTHTETYNGTGGLRQLYFGMGYMPFKGLSIGANISYLWGDYTRYMANTYSDSNVKTLTRLYIAEINSYRLDLGLQYTAKVTKNDEVTIGATYTQGHKLNGSVGVLDVSAGAEGINDTTSTYLSNSLSLPTMIGGGLSWYHGNKLHVGIDYQRQMWSKDSYPDLRYYNKKPTLTLVDDVLLDRQRFVVGAEYVNKATSRDYINRVHFRLGFSYTTPYTKINGVDGPSEIGASIGLGLPITNSWNNRSMLNISGQWVRSSATGLITENTFRITLGITFNERWFAKWKMD